MLFRSLVIVRPGAEGFNAYAYWAIGAVLFVTLRDLVTVNLSARAPSLFIALLAAISITIVGGLMSLTEPWKPVSTTELSLLAGAALFLIGGYLFGIMAMRVGEIAFVSPFRYTVLLWSIVLGIVIFDEIPDGWTLTGSAIVIAMGVYTFHRERLNRKNSLRQTEDNSN